MRRKLIIIATATALLVLGSTGVAIGHDLPGQGCDHAAEGKNKHCDEDHAHAVATADGGDGHDADGDGVETTAPVDNCPGAYNPKQGDYDGDGIGNVCDHALDGDNEDGVCSAPQQLCGKPKTNKDDDADDLNYANDTDGDGFGDEDEDGIGS